MTQPGSPQESGGTRLQFDETSQVAQVWPLNPKTVVNPFA